MGAPRVTAERTHRQQKTVTDTQKDKGTKAQRNKRKETRLVREMYSETTRIVAEIQKQIGQPQRRRNAGGHEDSKALETETKM